MPEFPPRFIALYLRDLSLEYAAAFGGFAQEELAIQTEILMMLSSPFEIESFRNLVIPYLPEFWIVSDFTDSFANIEPSVQIIYD